MADLAGELAYRFVPGTRAAVLANLAVVLATSPDDPALRPLAAEAFTTDARNWIDTLRIDRSAPEAMVQSVEVDHFERIEAAVAQGKGAILVTCHLGNFDLVGQYLMAKGYRLTIPVERMEPKELFDYLVSLRASNGINIVPLDRAPREMVRALRAGELVGVAGDRTVGGIGGTRTTFFGRTAILPHGPVSLARRTGSPLLLAVGIRRRDEGFLGHVSGPIPMVKTSDSEADDRENMARLVTEMERIIAEYPGQWLQFSPLWGANDASGEAATMNHHTEATV
jgi:KDO2-lipid IV(A) lauroyltransferase